jgi:hypothetical protein
MSRSRADIRSAKETETRIAKAKRGGRASAGSAKRPLRSRADKAMRGGRAPVRRRFNDFEGGGDNSLEAARTQHRVRCSRRSCTDVH